MTSRRRGELTPALTGNFLIPVALAEAGTQVFVTC